MVAECWRMVTTPFPTRVDSWSERESWARVKTTSTTERMQGGGGVYLDLRDEGEGFGW